MSTNFMNSVKKEMLDNYNVSRTENGAIGYRTTGKALVDINFAIASLRKASDEEIIDRFMKAYHEDNLLAVKWLFFCRDAREGAGERRLFRKCFANIVRLYPDSCKDLIKLIPEYGRWDDLIDLLISENVENKDIQKTITTYILETLSSDIQNMKNNKSVSLLGKWMPSINASSKDTIKAAKTLIKLFNKEEYDFLGNNMKFFWTEKIYRQLLSKLRSYIDVTEVKMSNNEWNKINYEAVPSKANLNYNNAFLKHDEERRREFLSALANGKAKINSSVAFPHEIVNKYWENPYSFWCNTQIGPYNEALEGMWKNLPDMVKGNGNTLVVADGSGSMTCCVDRSSRVTALMVANALAIYFSEHCSGEFRNKYITFSNRPQFVEFREGMSLRDKLEYCLKFNEVSGTNIEATFKLILNTAVKNNMKQEDIPTNILVISDMEFNGYGAVYGHEVNESLFNSLAKDYAQYGYKLPRLVFWNVNSRTRTIPVRENDCGVALVSGFSVNICKMVLSGKTDPYENLVETLNSERYQPVEDAWLKDNKNKISRKNNMNIRKKNFWDEFIGGNS